MKGRFCSSVMPLRRRKEGRELCVAGRVYRRVRESCVIIMALKSVSKSFQGERRSITPSKDMCGKKEMYCREAT